MSLICPDAVIAAMQAAGAALCGTASLGAAYLMGRYVIADGDDGSRSLLMLALYVPALLFGYVVGLLPVNLMEGGTTMMYLAFAEDPLVLEETDDHLYMDLLDAWQVAVEEQQVLAEEDAGGVDVASEDALSHSSMESSDVDDEELAAMPNDRMKKWRKQLTMGGTNTAHQRSLVSEHWGFIIVLSSS